MPPTTPVVVILSEAKNLNLTLGRNPAELLPYSKHDKRVAMIPVGQTFLSAAAEAFLLVLSDVEGFAMAETILSARAGRKACPTNRASALVILPVPSEVEGSAAKDLNCPVAPADAEMLRFAQHDRRMEDNLELARFLFAQEKGR